LAKIAENSDHKIDPWDRWYDFKNIFAKTNGQKNAHFWLKTK
jgi:hypothetical protein